MSRELTIIFAAEVVRSDYSPADDRYTTNDVLSAYEGILADCVQRHHGRTIEGSSVSGLLAGFSNAFDALSCAVEIQRDGVDKIETSSAAVPLRLSIGVNHEVLPNEGKIRSCNEDNDVARLVALAEPGGICISRTVYDEVRFKIKLPYMTERDPVHTAYS